MLKTIIAPEETIKREKVIAKYIEVFERSAQDVRIPRLQSST
jgi:hypothetical protein